MNIWIQLYERATARGDVTAIIKPMDEGDVILVWPDGSQRRLFWHGGAWQDEDTVAAALETV